MDVDIARDFVRRHHRGVLATFRRDGRPQMSPVLAVVDSAGRIVISSTESTVKTQNLRRDPRAALVVFTDQFFGDWIQVEGDVEIVSLPEAMEPLVDYYRRAASEHPDWDDYRRAMVADRRVILRLTVARAGPSSGAG